VIGKKVKALRRTGVTPMNLYGSGIASVAVQANTKELRKTLTQSGRSKSLQLLIQNGDEHTVFVRDICFHPVSGDILHVDLFRVDASSIIRIEVPISLYGESMAVRDAGGLLVQNTLSVIIEAKTEDIPEFVYVDISVLKTFADTIRVADIKLGDGVTVVSEPASIVVTVNAPRVATSETSSDSPAASQPDRVSEADQSQD
jgi:large subunit ribosomal protein L25